MRRLAWRRSARAAPAEMPAADGSAGQRPAGLPAGGSLLAALREAGVPSPEADAELLIAEVLGLSRGQLQLRAITGAELPSSQRRRLDELLQRRAAREPLQHIIGRAAFRGLELRVGPGVF